jgi:hypothetical protein
MAAFSAQEPHVAPPPIHPDPAVPTPQPGPYPPTTGPTSSPTHTRSDPSRRALRSTPRAAPPHQAATRPPHHQAPPTDAGQPAPGISPENKANGRPDGALSTVSTGSPQNQPLSDLPHIVTRRRHVTNIVSRRQKRGLGVGPAWSPSKKPTPRRLGDVLVREVALSTGVMLGHSVVSQRFHSSGSAGGGHRETRTLFLIVDHDQLRLSCCHTTSARRHCSMARMQSMQ